MRSSGHHPAGSAHRARHRLAQGLVIATLAVAPGWRATAAQPGAAPNEPSAADKETARHLYQTGVERYRAEDYHGALEAFRAADRIMGVPTTGLELGRTQATLGLLVEARDRLLQVTRYPISSGEPAPFAQARQEAARLAADLADRIPSIQVQLQGPEGPLPADVEPTVKVDEAVIPPDLLGVPRRLNPGEHLVSVHADGYRAETRTITLAERDQRVASIRLVPNGGADRTGDGGQDAGDPTVGDEPSGAGEPSPVQLSPLVWIGFGVGAAGLLTGTIAGGVALSEASSLDEQCPDGRCSPAQQDDLDAANRIGHVSTAGFVVGGVGVAAGIVGLLLSDWGEGGGDAAAGTVRTSDVAVEPLIGIGGGGLRGWF